MLAGGPFRSRAGGDERFEAASHGGAALDVRRARTHVVLPGLLEGPLRALDVAPARAIPARPAPVQAPVESRRKYAVFDGVPRLDAFLLARF